MIALTIAACLMVGGGTFWLILEGINYIAKEDLTQWHMTYCFRGKRGFDCFWIPAGPMMRRDVNGEWQYRAMTKDEMQDWDECAA